MQCFRSTSTRIRIGATTLAMPWMSITLFLLVIVTIITLVVSPYSAIGQSQVNMRVPLQQPAAPTAAPSIRYSNRYVTSRQTRMLPSESRYRISASGKLPSEQRYGRYMDGALRSEGAAVHLTRPSVRYNNYYNSYRVPSATPSARPSIRYAQPQAIGIGGVGRPTSSHQVHHGMGAQKLGGKISAKSPYARGTIRYGG